MYPQFYENPILVLVRASSKEEITRQKILFYKISDTISASMVRFLDLSGFSSRNELMDAIVKTAERFYISVVAIEKFSILADSLNEAQEIARFLLNSNLKIFISSNTKHPLIEMHRCDPPIYSDWLEK